MLVVVTLLVSGSASARGTVPAGESATSGTIVFSREERICCGSGLYTVKPDGTQEVRLPGFAHNRAPAWSPDGKRIAFTATDAGSMDLYVMDIVGPRAGEPRMIVHSPGFQEWYPTWSPDGTRIAFARWWYVEQQQTANEIAFSIWTVGADGRGLRPLTDGADPRDHSPSWSPDGKWIAFVREDNQEPGSASHVYLIRADGRRVRRVTHGNVSATRPRWSPDGRLIAFQGRAFRNQQDVAVDQTGVYVVRPAGGDPRRVVRASLNDALCWSPDGTRIAFAQSGVGVHAFGRTQDAPPPDLYSVRLDGSGLHRITFTPQAAEKDCDWRDA